MDGARGQFRSTFRRSRLGFGTQRGQSVLRTPLGGLCSVYVSPKGIPQNASHLPHYFYTFYLCLFNTGALKPTWTPEGVRKGWGHGPHIDTGVLLPMTNP